MSLRTKLLILFVMLLIPLGITGKIMIEISRIELEETVKSELIMSASEVTKNIEDFYRFKWLTPLLLIKKSVESDLAFEGILSLLTEGIKNLHDVVALQISVEDIPQRKPMLVIKEEFSDRLRKLSLDPNQFMRLTPGRISMLRKQNEIFSGDLIYLAKTDTWLFTIILPLEQKVFGAPATLSARINLEELKKRIDNHPFNRKGFIYLIDPDGYKILDRNTPNLSEYSLVKKLKELLASDNLPKYSLTEPYTSPSGKKMLAAYDFPDGLHMAVIVEQDEIRAFAAITEMRQRLLYAMIAGFSIAILGAVAVTFSMTMPLRKLTRAVRVISEGNLNVHVSGIRRTDEIGELAVAFDRMVKDLNRYIEELTRTTRAKERAEGELKLAKTIQQSFLPKEFPESGKIEVWGTCEPAREVGGDYFDFFQIDDENYGMVIGDVSGKGVPAALFMAVSRTLFRILSSQEYFPDQVLKCFNDQLVALDQGANMFITLFYGVFNKKDGKLLYSTAGHNMPYVRLSSHPSDKFCVLPPMKTMVAGMMDDIPLQLAETRLTQGDIIVLYTDGMTEAVNDQNEEFGEKRLEELLNTYAHLPAKEICQRLITDVQAFQHGRAQFDDMTLFVLKVRE